MFGTNPIFEAYGLGYSCQMSIVYDGKGDIGGFKFAEGKEGQIETALSNIYGIISSSVKSIEGYFHSIVFVDAATEYSHYTDGYMD